MSVPAGYKATEVGVIPEDWEVTTLGSIGKFKNGINKPKEAFGSGYPFVNLMDVFGVSNINATDHLGLIKSNDFDRSMYDLKLGDVLFIRSSVKPSGVGLTTVVTQDLLRTVYSGFLLRFRDQGQLTTGFKEHCFHGERFRARIIANSTVSANTNINQSALKALVIGYPPTTAEQTAIAEALTDVDDAIAAQKGVIAKKRALKTATMQALLSGNRRLPGFSGEWKTTLLGTLMRLKVGYPFQSRHFSNQPNGVPLVRNRDLRSVGQSLYYTGPFHEDYLIYSGDLIIGMDGDFTPVIWRKGKALLNQRVGKILPRADINLGYFGYRLLAPLAELERVISGTTVKHLSHSDLEKIEIPVPSLNEQEEISKVLIDIDNDIDVDENMLAKLHHIKTGMMQQLLTGKIRLV